jgi:hypothetical protein
VAIFQPYDLSFLFLRNFTTSLIQPMIVRATSRDLTQTHRPREIAVTFSKICGIHNGLIGIGGTVACPPLPHHRTCGSPGRTMARIGLRMMPPSPWSPLKFRKAGVPCYGFKASISDGPSRRLRVLRVVQFASVLRAPGYLQRRAPF